MEQKRFSEKGKTSFYGDYLYEQVVPTNYFFRKLLQIVDWDLFTDKLINLYRWEGDRCQLPVDPALVLKMELIAYFYKLTKCQVERYINENLPAKFFMGLTVDQKAPDHSTLNLFRERLLARGKQEDFEEILDEIIQIAQDKGLQFGSFQILDSVHSVANANTPKDKKGLRMLVYWTISSINLIGP
ncbi:MAG: transposase [Anaerolineales bacterium]